ncbi:MAG: hypothetical protein WC551_02370 [Patescibacteria group bacterium]
MRRNKHKALAVQVENLRLAFETIRSSPLGEGLHPKLGKINTPGTFRMVLIDAMTRAPRGIFLRLSGIDDTLLWFYKAGRRFPDKVRMASLLKTINLVFFAEDAGRLDILKELPAAKLLQGKIVSLRDVDLGRHLLQAVVPQTAVAETQQRAPVLEDKPTEPKSMELPPNIIGAHFIALRGAADAFCEMVNFGRVELRPEDRSQMAEIVITLLKLGKIDAEAFQVALHGQPISPDDKDMFSLVKAFTGNKRNR